MIGRRIDLVVEGKGREWMERFSLDEEISIVVIRDIVAVVVPLDVVDQGLEVEVWQLVHHIKHDVLEELVIDLGSPGHHLQVATVLRQASVQNSVVLIIGVDNRILEPLVMAISDEALSVLNVIGAVHLSMAAKVWAKSGVLSNGVLHERTTIVHVRVDDLATCPLILGEWSFIDVEDLIPSAQEVLPLKFILEWSDIVTDDILFANLAIVD